MLAIEGKKPLGFDNLKTECKDIGDDDTAKLKQLIIHIIMKNK